MGNKSVTGNNSNAGLSSMSGFGMATMQTQPLHMMSSSTPRSQAPPDLSAFDSLLPSTNKNVKSLPMNSMAQKKVN